MFDPERMGRIGEMAVVASFLREGWDVFTPAFGTTRCDLVVVRGDEVRRVETKTTQNRRPSGKYEVNLMSFKGHGDRKKFDGSKSDVLAVYVEPTGRLHLLDSKKFDGRRSVTVEG